MADRYEGARFDRYDPFGLESPFAEQPESASSSSRDSFEPEFEPFAQELVEPDLNPFREAPTSSATAAAGGGVAFPSGLVLNSAQGATGYKEEHYDPNHVNLPLLDTGPHVQDLPISEHFKVKEFVLSSGLYAPVARISPELVRQVQAIRDRAGKAVKISSGYRSYLHNIDVYERRNEKLVAAGKPKQKITNSRHSSGQAVDLSIAGMSAVAQAKLAVDIAGPDIGIGLGKGYIHFDVRGKTAVWNYGGSTAAEIAEVLAYARARKRKSAPAPVPAGAANRIVVDRLAMLATHSGTHPDLIVRWNDIARSDVVDVVVHFHGYADGQKEAMQLSLHKESMSGLDLADPANPSVARSRPTITILPRGHWSPTKKHPGAYRFPALLAKGQLDRLIDEAIALVNARYSRTFSRGRLILTAHSGGGAAIDAVLANADPDEIHLHDATYTDPATLLAWAARRIASEVASPISPAPALRAIFNPQSDTGTRARALAAGLCKLLAASGAARLSDRFRVGRTALAHNDIPRRFGWRLLVDAGADLPRTTTLACARGAASEAFDDEELAWLDFGEGRAEFEEEQDWEGSAEVDFEREEEDFSADESPFGSLGEEFDEESDFLAVEEDEAGEADSDFEENEESEGPIGEDLLEADEAFLDEEGELEDEGGLSFGVEGEEEYSDEVLARGGPALGEDLDLEEEGIVDGEAPLWRSGKDFSTTAISSADIVGIVRDDGKILLAVDRTGRKVVGLSAAVAGSLELGAGRPIHRCRMAALAKVKGIAGRLRGGPSGPILYALADGTVLFRKTGKFVVGATAASLPPALLTSLTHGIRAELTDYFYFVWMTFRIRRETKERSRWVRASHTQSEIDARRGQFRAACARLSAAEQAIVHPYLDVMAVVSAQEGGFGDLAGPGDTSASLGIFQWAMARKKNPNNEPGSLGEFFRKLKERAAAAGADPVYVKAWDECTKRKLDFRAKDGKLTINGTVATADQVANTMAPAMALDDLASYQLRAGVDWIEDFRTTPITPGPAGSILLGHSWAPLRDKSKASLVLRGRTLEVSMPGASTVGQVFTTNAPLATAVMLGVNRPNFVRLALWRALSTSGDANAETGRLLDAVLKACIAAKQVPRRGHPFTETEVTAAGPAAVAAYQALQAFLVVPATLPAGGEAALRASFESKAMILYPSADAKNREKRFATVRVQFP